MATHPPRFYLRPSEQVVRAEGVTTAWGFEQAFVWLVLGLVLFGGLALGIVFGRLPQPQTLLLIDAIAFALFWIAGLLYTWRRIATSEYTVTDEAVYTRRGQLLLNVGAASLDRVTDLHVHTGIFGRLFGYSSLAVKTAGGGLYMVGLRDAYTIRGTIHDVRQRLLTRLLREAGRATTATPTTVEAGTLEIQCPNCQHAFGVRGAPPLDVQCPRCQSTGTLFAEALA